MGRGGGETHTCYNINNIHEWELISMTNRITISNILISMQNVYIYVNKIQCKLNTLILNIIGDRKERHILTPIRHSIVAHSVSGLYVHMR